MGEPLIGMIFEYAPALPLGSRRRQHPIDAVNLLLPLSDKLLQEEVNVLPLLMHPRHFIVPPHRPLLVHILQHVQAVQRRIQCTPQISFARFRAAV